MLFTWWRMCMWAAYQETMVANLSYLPPHISAKDRAKQYPDILHEQGWRFRMAEYGSCHSELWFVYSVTGGNLALYHLINHNTFRFSEGGPSSNPELIKWFVSGWGERYCNNVNYVKNDAIFKPPSMRACSSTPPKQNQDFVEEHNRTPLINEIII